jgi:integrase
MIEEDLRAEAGQAGGKHLIVPLIYLPVNIYYSVWRLSKQGDCPMNAHLQLVRSCNVNRKVGPVLRRPANAELRTREYLTPAEVEKLMAAAKDGRWGHRDATLVMVAYRHGLRAKEAAELEWSQVEFGRSACLHVRRAKSGKPSVHPIRGDELRMLTALRKERPDSGYVFTTERGTPFTPDAINRLIKIIGRRAGLQLPVHFHMLRHACGYALANKGVDTRAIQDWLDHRSIAHTTRYTELSPVRFKDFWRE